MVILSLCSFLSVFINLSHLDCRLSRLKKFFFSRGFFLVVTFGLFWVLYLSFFPRSLPLQKLVSLRIYQI